MVFNNSAYWHELKNLRGIFDWFSLNPILYATIMVKARASANMRPKVVNRWTMQPEPITTRKEIPAAIYKKLERPNVTQSFWEWRLQKKIFDELAGNSFTYGNFTMGFTRDVKMLTALWNVWPAFMSYKLGNAYFEATKMSDIIKEWKFELGQYKKVWTADEIMHKNKPNTDPRNGLIFGTPPIMSLIRPLTNIDMAYESRNVLMKNRGMRVILTSEKEDASGVIPLQESEKKIVQNQIKDYGLLSNQSQFFFSQFPLKAVPIDQDVAKLGLFEEIATDTLTIAHGFGVPELLVKLYIKGGTFENLEASERRLYQSTLIPEDVDDMQALGNFLGLDETDWMLLPDYSHIACLQESEDKKETREKTKSDRLLNALAKNAITKDEYREEMGYGKATVDPAAEAALKAGGDERTLEAQAQLRGSVGGVQGILSIQASVSQGITTYDAAIGTLEILYGFTPEQSKILLGDPAPTTPTDQTQNNGNQENQSGQGQDTGGN